MTAQISIRPSQVPAGIIHRGNGNLGSYGKEIAWNTQPVINSLPYNRDGYWDCADWMTWHGKVEAKYGVKRANEVFMIWWNKQGGFAYAQQQCYIYNRSFRDFWKAKGLPAETWLDFSLKPVDVIVDASGKVLDTAGTVVNTTADAATNIVQAAGNVAKSLKWVAPTLLVVGAAGLGVWAYNKYLK